MFNKYLDPKNDVAFKKIFGTEKNKDILIHFLNDMITFRERQPIVSVTFLKTIQDPETATKKTSIVDILCKDESGNQYIVEMQVAKEKGFEKRAQYYASKAYISQAVKGGEYSDLKEIIFLAIADFVMFPKKPGFKSDHVIFDVQDQECDLKDFSFTFLELPKFNLDIDNLSTMTEKWAYFFKHAETTSAEEREKLKSDAAIIDKAYAQLSPVLWNDEELRTYDQWEKYEGAYLASMAQKLEEGLEKGKEIGLAIGLDQGKTEAQLNTVRAMIKKQYDFHEIAEISGLSIAEIQRIASE